MGKSPLSFKGITTPVVKPLKPEVGPTNAEAVSFEDLKTKVLTPKCLRCHSNLADEETFQSMLILGNPDETTLFQSVEKGRMPLGDKPLPSAELELLRDYIKTTKSVKEVSFAKLKSSFLETKCLACHKNWTTEENFLKRNVVRGDAEKSDMYDSVKNAWMPKAPKNPDGTAGTIIPLSASDVELMKSYINALKP